MKVAPYRTCPHPPASFIGRHSSSLIAGNCSRLFAFGMRTLRCAVLALALFLPALGWAQLGPGDIVFLRYNTDATDAVSWAPMVPLAAGEQLYFTEQGWVNGAWLGNPESHYLYTAPAGGLAAGTVVHFESATPMQVSPGGGTLVKVVGTNEFLNLSAGDQVLAYTSSTGPQPATPVFLGGVHGDYNWGNPTEGPRYNPITTWNIGNSIAVSDSHLPLGLTNAHTAISLFPHPAHQDLVTPDLNYYGEQDNARYKLTAPTNGTRTQLLFALNNPANWDSDDTTAYASNTTVTSLTVLPDPATGVLPLGAPRTSLRAGALTLPSYEVPAGENRLLVVGAGNSGSTDITGVSFGGTAMTQVVEEDDTVAVDSIWVLALGTSATSTTGDVVVTHAGTGDVQFIGAMAFARVDQSTPTSGALQFAGSGSPRSFTVTSAAGDMVLDLLDLFAASAAPTTAPVETRGMTHFARTALGSHYGTYAMSMIPGSASVPMGWTNNATAVIHLAVNLRQASAAPASVAPTVTTPTQTAITLNSATLGGDVTADGGASITARGVVYSQTSLNANPQLGGASVTNLPHGSNSTGVFTVNATGLTPGTQYSFAAYATNSVGTTYTTPVSTLTTTAAVTVTSLARTDATPTNAGTVNWTLTFGSAVTGVTSSNFALTGAAAAGLSVGTPTTGNGGLTWNIPVTTGATDGALTLTLANFIGLSATISNTPFPGESYTIDKTPPTVVSVTRLAPAGQNTNLTTVTFRVTYSEPVNLTAPAINRFQVVPVNGSDIVGTVTSVTGTGNTRDVTVDLTSGTGEFRLRVID